MPYHEAGHVAEVNPMDNLHYDVGLGEIPGPPTGDITGESPIARVVVDCP